MNGRERGSGRTNFTLDAETMKLLSAYMDDIERDTGFRPSKAQAVHGLIVKASELRGCQ